MSDAQAEFKRGLTALQAGDRSSALSGFLMALALDPDNPGHRRYAVDLLGTTGGYTSLPRPVLDGLARCTEDPSLDLQPLALVARTLLEHNPKRQEWLSLVESDEAQEVERALAQGYFDDLLNDPITQAVLQHATNISLDLEDILSGLRRHALTCAAAGNTSVLLTRHQIFFCALATQAERSDFAWLETEAESESLKQIAGSIHAQLLSGAYRQSESPSHPSFSELTPIRNSISRRVQHQYIAFPYPRWERLPQQEQTSLLHFVSARFPEEDWPGRFSGPATGLSAGCGTGRGALMLAQSVKDLSLTAMDLSPTSLAFAASKAKDLKIGGVEFGLGDILELSTLDRRFDIIESSGVLHHMDDPAAGLKALVRTLAPDGVMRIALYSERARAAVIAAREWIRKEGIGDSVEEMRHARTRLRSLPEGHRAKDVIETPEFFVLSGLHDLIFNVQEHRFTPRGLRQLLEGTGLRFLGFDHTDPSVPGLYAAAFPGDTSQTDMDNWDSFEQNHPDTFAEMYQVWCRPV